MTFHTNFWLAAAAAAPVIALANVVTYGRMAELRSAVSPKVRGPAVTYAMRAAAVTGLIAMLSFIDTSTVTIYALHTLSVEHTGEISEGVVQGLLAASFVLLLAGAGLEFGARLALWHAPYDEP